MTRIHDGERGFREHFLEGLTAAYPRYLRQVPDASAVMASDSPIPGQVSVIIGGGSGHYPAFAGLVGPGLCHGAVVGDVFTSPSATQAYRAIEALDGGAGVLLSFGNYSGDVMHFGLAAEQARARGIDTRIVLVTDDVASRPVEEVDQRRGIAGGFFVFRAASAAARRGDDLGTVERIARHANERTRTFGIALSGCTFPGRSGRVRVRPPRDPGTRRGRGAEPRRARGATGAGGDPGCHRARGARAGTSRRRRR
jgi:dihydroxyacetone kinase